MGSVGDAYDNAMCESLFAMLECELLARCRFKTQADARSAVFTFIEDFCNPPAVTLRSDISHRSTTSAGMRRRQSIPTHTSVPSCSRPSRTAPRGAVLIADAHDGRTGVRAGTEESLRRGPNQRMPQNSRTK
jgi:hypothetical protein